MPAEQHSNGDFPSPDVANRRVVAIAAGLMLLMLGSVAMLLGFYVWQSPERALPPPQELPAPQVRTDERLLRHQLEAAQRSRLSGYRWQDAQNGLIGIPIERAIEILAARGAKAYDPIIAPGTTTQSRGADAAAAVQNPQSRVPANKEPKP